MTTVTDPRQGARPEEAGAISTPAVVPGDSCASLFEFAPAGYLTMDPRGWVTRVNFTAASMLGASRDQIRGRPFSRFVRHEDEARFTDLLDRVVREPGCRCCDLALRRSDGPEFEGCLLCQARIPAGERSPAVRVILIDVSDRARLEETLRRENTHLRHVTEGSNDGHWEVDVTTGRATFSRRWATMLGLEPGEVSSGLQSWVTRVHPDDATAMRLAFARHVRGESERIEIEYRLRHKEGHWVWVLARGKVVERDGSGRPTRLAGANTDVTRRKESEAGARTREAGPPSSEGHPSQILDRLPVPVLIAGPDGAVTFANDESVRVLGHATEAVPALGDWLRRWAFERAHVRSRAVAVDGAGREAPAQGEPVAPFQVPVTGKDGTERTMLVTAAPLGESLLLVLADLSVERSFLDRVALASRAAALAMLGVALSHEVNNPLAAEMADEGVATETCRAARDRLRTEEPVDLQVVARLLEGAIEALVDAQESGHQISRVVRELARVARPDAERVRELPIDLVHTACRWIPPLVSRTSSVVVEDGGAPAVLAFPGQIEQVILSLIMQAARSSSGGARDTVIVRLGTGPGGCARLEIIDHGPGLDPETRARLLDPRFTPAPATAAEGLGPCLVVCRAIVEAHGGTLSVESALERGTTVRVELPGASMEG